MQDLDAELERAPECYRDLREQLDLPPVERSARFLWLSAMAFNGLWRVNSKGVMNVPPDPGRLDSTTALPPIQAYREMAEHVRRVHFFDDWRAARLAVEADDLVLADPPFADGFVGYTAEGFTPDDQGMVARSLSEFAAAGCAVIAFNSPSARYFYEWADIQEVKRAGDVSSKVTQREPVDELLITANLQGRRSGRRTSR